MHVLAHLAGQLAEDGFLVLGQDEYPFSLAESFCNIGDVPGIFARRLALPAPGKRANHLRLVSSR